MVRARDTAAMFAACRDSAYGHGGTLLVPYSYPNPRANLFAKEFLSRADHLQVLAAHYGDYRLLHQLRAFGQSPVVCTVLAMRGHGATLLRLRRRGVGAPWPMMSNTVTRGAVISGSVALVRALAPFNLGNTTLETAQAFAAGLGETEMLAELTTKTALAAAPMSVWWLRQLYQEAMRGGHIATLLWLERRWGVPSPSAPISIRLPETGGDAVLAWIRRALPAATPRQICDAALLAENVEMLAALVEEDPSLFAEGAAGLVRGLIRLRRPRLLIDVPERNRGAATSEAIATMVVNLMAEGCLEAAKLWAALYGDTKLASAASRRGHLAIFRMAVGRDFEWARAAVRKNAPDRIRRWLAVHAGPREQGASGR